MAISRYTIAFDRAVGKWSYRIHRRLYKMTGGVIGKRSPLGPMLLLTSIGRRSGEPRTTPLLYMPAEDGYYVVGSNGGRDAPPNWLLNLEAHPKATIQVGRRKVTVTAHVLRGKEKQAVWPRMVTHYSGWDHYQHLTDREIPAVHLQTVS